jgi:hypothetical protein
MMFPTLPRRQLLREMWMQPHLVMAEGRWAATWAGNLDAARAAIASGLLMLCHSLLLECGIV